VGLKRHPLILVSTIEELFGRNSSGSGLETKKYGGGDPLRRSHDTFYPQMLALTSLTSGGRTVGIVPLRTKATKFCLYRVLWDWETPLFPSFFIFLHFLHPTLPSVLRLFP
jgi:hypothetical protein